MPKDPDAWPATAVEQTRSVQALLREFRFYKDPPDGRLGQATRAAIREYQGIAGLPVTGQPDKALFDSLKEMQELTRPKSKAGSN
ncbi:peptidoglycan-binding domain-containing protein [uncultured Reyranella sp.]|nr:peptidoglycan-binding domain-containing protein [uncultured Reyranella sp.]